MKPEEMHNLKVHFGKYSGELWTRIPLSYLRWCVNENVHAEYAKAELERRGSSQMPKIELSNHAIDRASQRFIDRWIQETEKKIGLHTWLHDLALEAYESDKYNVEIKYKKMTFKFSEGCEYPTLLTVY
jgi:hypothetical protein